MRQNLILNSFVLFLTSLLETFVNNVKNRQFFAFTLKKGYKSNQR
jgi:hypothetical protein